MFCNKALFQESLDCFDNDIVNNLENNACSLEYNAKQITGNSEQNNAKNYEHNYIPQP